MTPEEEFRLRILAAQREGERALAALLAPLSLTPAQSETLQRIGKAEPVSLAGLGKLLVCETGSPSRLVDTLVKRGLVKRDQAVEDRRAVTLSCTVAGRKLAAQAAQVETDLHGWIGGIVPADELQRALSVLRRLTAGSAGDAAIRWRMTDRS